VFNSSLSAQCVADLNGIIISVNPAFLKLWGYESEVDAIGISLGDFFVNPDDATSVLEALVKPGEWKGNFLAKKSDGSHFISQALATALYTENGEHIGFQSANIDITERIKSRKKLKNALEDLKRSNAELEQFAYVASHDLQEPLRMVASFTQLLQKRYIDKLDQDANDFINYAVDGAIRMQSLINDLLAFSRVGTQKAAFNETDMNLILEQVKSNLSYSIKDTGAIITNDPLPVVIADESQMIQLIQNLISNAIKFQKKNATPIIHISGKTEENQWIFSVKDNGIGIDPQFFDRIFIIFQRLHKKDEYGGTGIGLSVCRKIAQRHGGKIWIESEPDKGTTFYLTLKTSIKNAIIDEKMGEN
jgi:chemotaxis family two-component system sensor kinase Cph1